jgi:hypothetical protein
MTAAGLWLAVVASGLYHGLNPGMGWPLVVSAGLMGRGRREFPPALGALGLGHLAAMALVLAPFSLLVTLVEWQREIRLVAGGLVMAAGVGLLIFRRHPRVLARIPPHRLALWSFAIATAHGAGLMLVPIYLGLCGPEELDAAHRAAGTLMTQGALLAVAVAAAHTAAMLASGGLAALLVHDWLGLKALSRSWFNLDALWAGSLVLVGALGAAAAWADPG